MNRQNFNTAPSSMRKQLCLQAYSENQENVNITPPPPPPRCQGRVTRHSLWSLLLPLLLALCAQAQAQTDSHAIGAPIVTAADSADLTIAGSAEDSIFIAAQSAIAYADGITAFGHTRGMTSGELDGAANSVNNPPTIIHAADTSETPRRQAPGKDGQAGPGDDDIQPIATDNTRATAIAVTLGTPVSATISPGGDVDFYSFTLTSSLVVTIQTTGMTDVDGELQNSTGTVLESDDDQAANLNFRIDRHLNAGTYYIRVFGSNGAITGNYSLSVTSDSTRDGANAITLGATVSDSISPNTDIDYYRFALASPSAVTIQTIGTALNTTGQLQDSTGTVLESDRSSGAGGNFRIQRILGAGTYYIRVASSVSSQGTFEAGNYGLSVTGATAVTARTPVSDSISRTGDVDYYRFALASPAPVVIETTGMTDTKGQLHNSAGTVLEADNNDGTGANFRIERVLSAGAYFIRVAGQVLELTTGNYGLSVTEVSTTPVTVGTPVSGSISPAGDVDYYSFTLAQPLAVIIETTGTSNPSGQLLDSAGTELGRDFLSGAGDNFRIERELGAGDYFIRVQGQVPSVTGNYGLSVTTTDIRLRLRLFLEGPLR